jgi:hypothetical protein
MKLYATIAALLLSLAAFAACGVEVTSAGCVRILAGTDRGAPPADDWIYHQPSYTWWDPEDGFIGWALTPTASIWQDTLTCAATDGAQRWPTNENGCTLVADQPGTPAPRGWEFWVQDDGDEYGYWANQTPPADAPRLGWSRGPDGDIWTVRQCAVTDGRSPYGGGS